jgi:hypothetical protein
MIKKYKAALSNNRLFITGSGGIVSNMADAPHASATTNTRDSLDMPGANVLLIVSIFGSVGHKP